MFYGECSDALLVEIRDLVDKNGEVWRTVAKISFLGGSIDANAKGISQKLLKDLEGKKVKIQGYWSQDNNYMNFNLTSIEALE